MLLRGDKMEHSHRWRCQMPKLDLPIDRRAASSTFNDEMIIKNSCRALNSNVLPSRGQQREPYRSPRPPTMIATTNPFLDLLATGEDDHISNHHHPPVLHTSSPVNTCIADGARMLLREAHCYILGIDGRPTEWCHAAQLLTAAARMGSLEARYTLALANRGYFNAPENSSAFFRDMCSLHEHIVCDHQRGLTRSGTPLQKQLDDDEYSSVRGATENALGAAYLEGFGTVFDLRRATEYFRLAVEDGCSDASLNLALTVLSYIDQSRESFDGLRHVFRVLDKISAVDNSPCRLGRRTQGHFLRQFLMDDGPDALAGATKLLDNLGEMGLSALNTIAAKSDRSALAMYNLGVAYESASFMEAAIKAYEQALPLPDAQHALLNLSDSQRCHERRYEDRARYRCFLTNIIADKEAFWDTPSCSCGRHRSSRKGSHSRMAASRPFLRCRHRLRPEEAVTPPRVIGEGLSPKNYSKIVPRTEDCCTCSSRGTCMCRSSPKPSSSDTERGSATTKMRRHPSVKEHVLCRQTLQDLRGCGFAMYPSRIYRAFLSHARALDLCCSGADMGTWLPLLVSSYGVRFFTLRVEPEDAAHQVDEALSTYINKYPMAGSRLRVDLQLKDVLTVFLHRFLLKELHSFSSSSNQHQKTLTCQLLADESVYEDDQIEDDEQPAEGSATTVWLRSRWSKLHNTCTSNRRLETDLVDAVTRPLSLVTELVNQEELEGSNGLWRLLILRGLLKATILAYVEGASEDMRKALQVCPNDDQYILHFLSMHINGIGILVDSANARGPTAALTESIHSSINVALASEFGRCTGEQSRKDDDMISHSQVSNSPLSCQEEALRQTTASAPLRQTGENSCTATEQTTVVENGGGYHCPSEDRLARQFCRDLELYLKSVPTDDLEEITGITAGVRQKLAPRGSEHLKRMEALERQWEKMSAKVKPEWKALSEAQRWDLRFFGSNNVASGSFTFTSTTTTCDSPLSRRQ